MTSDMSTMSIDVEPEKEWYREYRVGALPPTTYKWRLSVCKENCPSGKSRYLGYTEIVTRATMSANEEDQAIQTAYEELLLRGGEGAESNQVPHWSKVLQSLEISDLILLPSSLHLPFPDLRRLKWDMFWERKPVHIFDVESILYRSTPMLESLEVLFPYQVNPPMFSRRLNAVIHEASNLKSLILDIEHFAVTGIAEIQATSFPESLEKLDLGSFDFVFDDYSFLNCVPWNNLKQLTWHGGIRSDQARQMLWNHIANSRSLQEIEFYNFYCGFGEEMVIALTNNQSLKRIQIEIDLDYAEDFGGDVVEMWARVLNALRMIRSLVHKKENRTLREFTVNVSTSEPGGQGEVTEVEEISKQVNFYTQWNTSGYRPQLPAANKGLWASILSRAAAADDKTILFELVQRNHMDFPVIMDDLPSQKPRQRQHR